MILAAGVVLDATTESTAAPGHNQRDTIPMSDQELDLDNLNMLKELLADRFQELIETYLNDSSERIVKLREALEREDFTQATHEAHGLKGSSRNIGANPFANLCEVMEKQARAGAVQDGQQQLAAIEQKFAAIASQLKTLS